MNIEWLKGMNYDKLTHEQKIAHWKQILSEAERDINSWGSDPYDSPGDYQDYKEDRRSARIMLQELQDKTSSES